MLLTSFSLSAQTISSDRPGIGDGTSTLQRSQFQLETGVELMRRQAGKVNVFSQTTLPIALLRFGVSDRVELRFIQSYFFTDLPKMTGDFSKSGFSNTSIGSKVKLTENAENGVQTAALLEVVIPTGTEDMTYDGFLISLRYLHSWDFSERGNLNSNIGGFWAEENGVSLTYSFAVGYAINDRWAVFIEPFGDFYEFEDFNISIDGGLTYLLNSKMQMDVSVGTGINSDYYFIGLGFSWLIGKS